MTKFGVGSTKKQTRECLTKLSSTRDNVLTIIIIIYKIYENMDRVKFQGGEKGELNLIYG